MQRSILFLVILLSFALAANAQLPNKGNAYIGYSYLRLTVLQFGYRRSACLQIPRT